MEPNHAGERVVPEPAKELRRSQRVCVRLPIVVTGDGLDKKRFSEDTQTLVMNAHSALILLGARVALGQELIVKNLHTAEEARFRVANLGRPQEGKSAIGIEFVQPSPIFWHIAFPPPNWAPDHREARRRAEGRGSEPAEVGGGKRL